MSQTKAQLISDLVQALNFTGTASAPANGLFLSASNQLKFATASTERLKIDGTEVVVNDTGASVDFRIEGDTDTNLFVADASSDKIGIGAAPLSTGAKLEISRSLTDAFADASDTILRLLNTNTSANTNQTSLEFTTFTTGVGADSAIVSQAEDASGNSRLEFWTDTNNGMSEKMSIASNGTVTVGGNLDVGGNITVSNSAPRINLTDTGGNDFMIIVDGNDLNIQDTTAGQNRLNINSSGTVSCNFGLAVTGNMTATGNITATGGQLTLENGNEEQIHRFWSNTSDSDIYGLLSGSTFGTIVEGANNGHHVIALRDNDVNDSVAIISGGGDFKTGSPAETYDKLVARFRANGNTVIGGTLDVAGTLSCGDITSSDGNGNLTLKDNNHTGNNTEHKILFSASDNTELINFISPFGEQHLRLRYGSTELVKFEIGGNVGIGTTSPGRKFVVTEATANRVVNITTGGSSGAFVAFLDSNTTDDSKCRVGSIGGNALGMRGDSHSFQDGAGSTKMHIDSSGNVGIGTSTPQAQLEIKGTNDGGNFTALHLRNAGGDGSDVTINMISSTDQTNTAARSFIRSERVGSAPELAFGIANIERMRLTGSSLSFAGTKNGNAYEDATLIFNIVDSNGNSKKAQILSNKVNDIHSTLEFGTTVSNSFDERMRIHSDGNLLIGTTTSEDTTGNSGPKVITTGDITIDGNRKALVFRSTQSTAHQMSGIQWWNEIGAGVQCAIHGIREAVNKAPGALAFYTSNDVDTSSNNGEGEITEAMRIDSNQRILLGTTVSEDTTGNSGTKVISGGDITIDGDQKAFIFRSSASAAQIQSGIQWWNENGAGVMAKIHCIRSAINNAPGDLAFFTNTDVDTSANNSEGDITERMRILSSGEVDIYSAYTNAVGGTTRDLYVRSDGRLGYLSSIRASKTNIVDLTDISWLNNLKPKAFNVRKKNDSGEYTDNYYDELEYGLIAEDVESVNKELCSYSSDNTLEAVQYRKLVVPLLKAVQELTAKVAALEAA